MKSKLAKSVTAAAAGLGLLLAACESPQVTSTPAPSPTPTTIESIIMPASPIIISYYPEDVNCSMEKAVTSQRIIQLTTPSGNLTQKVESYEIALAWVPKEPLTLDGISVSGYTIPSGKRAYISVVIREEPDYLRIQQSAKETGSGSKVFETRFKTCSLFEDFVTGRQDNLVLPAKFDLNPGIKYVVGVGINGQNAESFEITLNPMQKQFYKPENNEGIAPVNATAPEYAGKASGIIRPGGMDEMMRTHQNTWEHIAEAITLTFSVTPR